MGFVSGLITGNWKAIAGFAAPWIYKGLNVGAEAMGAEVAAADISGTTAFILALMGGVVTWLSPANQPKAPAAPAADG